MPAWLSGSVSSIVRARTEAAQARTHPQLLQPMFQPDLNGNDAEPGIASLSGSEAATRTTAAASIHSSPCPHTACAKAVCTLSILHVPIAICLVYSPLTLSYPARLNIRFYQRF